MNLSTYDITPTPVAESPVCGTMEEFTVSAIAYETWNAMITAIDKQTLADRRSLLDKMIDYIPLVLCQLLRMGEERGMSRNFVGLTVAYATPTLAKGTPSRATRTPASTSVAGMNGGCQ